MIQSKNRLDFLAYSATLNKDLRLMLKSENSRRISKMNKIMVAAKVH